LLFTRFVSSSFTGASTVKVLVALQAVESRAAQELLASMTQTDAKKATWLMGRMVDAGQQALVAAWLGGMDRAVAGSLLAPFASRRLSKDPTPKVLAALQAVDSHLSQELLASIAQTDAGKAASLMKRMIDAGQQAQVAATLAGMDRALAGSLFAHFASRGYATENVLAALQAVDPAALQAFDPNATKQLLASIAKTDAKKAALMMNRMAYSGQEAQVAAALLVMDRAAARSLLASFIAHSFPGDPADPTKKVLAALQAVDPNAAQEIGGRVQSVTAVKGAGHPG
jgi:hypothetical protein